MTVARYDILPLTPDRFGDFETVLGGSGQSGCWCMYWLTEGSAAFRDGAKGGADAPNRSAFRARVAAGPPPGLLAYADHEPVGWVRILPRAAHPGLARSRLFATDLPVDGVWSISCFVIRAKWRRQGLSLLLARAAVRHARDNGARAVEAYATEAEGRRDPGSVYMGLASTFRRLGFEEVQRKAAGRPMMRLAL